MTNAQYVKNLEFNRERIIAGYRRYFFYHLKADAEKYGGLDFKIVNKYSKTKLPGVQLGQVCVFSYERAKFYADWNIEGERWQDCITEIQPVGLDKTYKVLYQNKAFVICKDKYDGRFSVYHIKTKWRVWSFENLEQAKLASENLLKFEIWDFENAKEFGLLEKDVIQKLSECITASILEARANERKLG